MTAPVTCGTCLSYGTVVTACRDGRVLRLRHVPCPTCGDRADARAGEWGGWQRRVAAEMASWLRDYDICPHCLGAGVLASLDVPAGTGMVEAPCPACGEAD